ncbi:hypothetical protein BHM03_00015677 [Ensete ventricosum]|nr:hypothetical protein BHM03_00015677 [Ensete ventricosum]
MGLVAHIPFYLLSLLSLRPLCLGHSDCSQFSRPRPIRSKWPLPLRIPPLAFLPPLLLQSLRLGPRNVGLAAPWEVNLIPRVRPRSRDWGFGVKWSACLISNVPPNLSDEESILVGRLKDILSASRAIRNLIEEWLVEVGLNPASRGMH